MKTETKKEVVEKLSLYVDESKVFDCSLERCAKNILALESRLRSENEYVKQNPDLFLRFNISIISDYDTSSYEIELSGVRLETDKEFEKRIAHNNDEAKRRKAEKARYKINKEKRDKRDYERLKKKFEAK